MFSMLSFCGSVLLLQGDKIPRERAILGVFLSLTMHCNAFAAEGIIEYATVATQAQIGIRKILSTGDAAYRPRRG